MAKCPNFKSSTVVIVVCCFFFFKADLRKESETSDSMEVLMGFSGFGKLFLLLI